MNVKFVVEGNNVKCTLTNCRGYVENHFNEILRNCAKRNNLRFISLKNVQNEFVAIAKLHPEDEFDLKTGKIVAYTKAKKQLLNHIANIEQEVVDTMCIVNKYLIIDKLKISSTPIKEYRKLNFKEV